MRSLSVVIVLLSLHLSLIAQSTGINLPVSTLPNTMLDVNGSASFREGTALALVNGVNNDVVLGNYSFFRVTGPTADFSVTGFTNGTDGRTLTIINATTQNMTVSHLTGSSAANQINTGGSAVVLLPNGVATLIYNSALTTWIVRGTNGTSITSWSLTGNTGTTAGTNFVGTTDGRDLVLKTNGTEGLRLSTAQNVGIGNSTARLHVEATGTNHAIYAPIGTNYNHFAGKTAFGRAFTTPTSTFVGTTADALWHFQDSLTTLGANIAEGLGVKIKLVPSTSSSTTLAYGINSRLHTQAYNSSNVGTALAGNFDFRHYGTGTIASAFGSISRAVVIGTGRINKAYGMAVDVGNYGGTIDSLWGVYISEGSFGTATSSTYARGIHIADLNAVNAHAIFQGGSNDKNYFSGYTGFGTDNPLARIHMVSNDAGSGNDIRVDAYHDSDAPNLSMRRSRGTSSAPTNLVSGDNMGGLNLFGYVGGALNWLSGVYGEYKGDGTTNLSNLVFRSSTAAQMVLDENGRLGIGTSGPNQQLELTAAMRMPATTTSTTGVIYKGSNRFIHDYKPSANDGNNTFVGVNAGNFTMASATSWLASGNTGLGANTLTALTTGGYNVAIGYNALAANTTGAYNMAIGSLSLAANIVGDGNVGVGHGTLSANTAGSNTAIGNSCLSSNTLGTANTGVGESNLMRNTTGNYNTAVGQSAMRENIGGTANTALGLSALQANTGGSYNLAIGNSSLVNNLSGNNNTGVGYNALVATTSSNNVGLGYLAGVGNTAGANNTFVGYNTGSTNTTGSNNTLLGYQANVSTSALTNATAIGNGVTVNASNKVRIGNASVTVIEGQVAWSFPSDKRLKKDITDNTLGLRFIKDLRPVHYVLKTDSTHTIQDGFIAQDIEATMNKLGVTFSGLNKPQSEKDNYSVAYSTFVVPLVNAVKELDANVEALTKEKAELKAQLEKQGKITEGVLSRLEKLEAALKNQLQQKQ
jgi:trimeric autotransporter adhesin